MWDPLITRKIAWLGVPYNMGKFIGGLKTKNIVQSCRK